MTPSFDQPRSALQVLALVFRIIGLSGRRLFGRDVMLYVGGVSFFALLAVFPAVSILIGIYGLFATPDQAAVQADLVAQFMPVGAQDLFRQEVLRLSHVPLGTVSTQSAFAGLIGAYAAHRGFKALLAGLSFIHNEDKPQGFVRFNLIALVVLIAAFALLGLVSVAFLMVRVLANASGVSLLAGVSWLFSEWVWASLGLSLGLSLIYRYVMSSEPVAWPAALLGGAVAAALTLAACWASGVYVKEIAHLGATYGSISAVIVFLIWVSWSVNAVFYGGALATETELALRKRP
jgi:membrane protein